MQKINYYKGKDSLVKEGLIEVMKNHKMMNKRVLVE